MPYPLIIRVAPLIEDQIENQIGNAVCRDCCQLHIISSESALVGSGQPWRPSYSSQHHETVCLGITIPIKQRSLPVVLQAAKGHVASKATARDCKLGRNIIQ